MRVKMRLCDAGSHAEQATARLALRAALGGGRRGVARSVEVGRLLARGALKGAHRRSVHLVNRSGGAGTVASLAELREAPELVVACVPPEGFEETVDAALAAGARAIVGITAGFPQAREAEVAE